MAKSLLPKKNCPHSNNFPKMENIRQSKNLPKTDVRYWEEHNIWINHTDDSIARSGILAFHLIPSGGIYVLPDIRSKARNKKRSTVSVFSSDLLLSRIESNRW